MGRFRTQALEDEEQPGVDMSPMMDCVFILLIFFIVTTTFVEETGVEVDKPYAASSEQLEKTSIMIALTDKGEVVYGGREIKLAGVRPLVARMLAGNGDGDKVPVIIQADDDSDSGLLIDIINEAKLAGAEKVSLSTLLPAH